MDVLSSANKTSRQIDDDPVIEQELLDMLANQVKHSPISVIISLSLIASLAYDVIPTQYLLSWFAFATALQFVRWYIFTRLPAMTQYLSLIHI